MEAGTSIFVDGALIADGNSTDLITFTSAAVTPAPGDWNAIEFRSNPNVGSVFNYVIVEYGGGPSRGAMVYYTTGAFAIPVSNSVFQFSGLHGINIRASSVTIDQSGFYDNLGYGVFSDLALNFTVKNSEILRNIDGGVRVHVNASPLIDNNDISENGVGVFIDNGGAPTVTNNEILANTIGIRFRDLGGTQPSISGNVISGNTDFGFQNVGLTGTVRARFNYWGSNLGPYHPALNPLGTGDEVSNNVDFIPWNTTSGTLPVVEITSNITSSRIWSADSVYWVKNNITVNSGVTLTLEPGTIVKMAPGTIFLVNGILDAVGNFGEFIVFTSERDDTYGGDTNGDGTNTIPAPGNWGYLYINSPGASSGSELKYVVIRFAGSPAALYVGGRLLNDELNNLYITNNSVRGIYYFISRQLSVRNSVIGSNGSHGIDYSTNQLLKVDSSSVDTNNDRGIRSSSTTRISNSYIRGNNHGGVLVIGATIDTLKNNIINENNGPGVQNDAATSSQLFTGNTIENNTGQGISNYNNSAEYFQVKIHNNIIKNNGQEGILSSRARIYNNEITGNQYPIGTWYRLGLRYTDDADNHTNVITGNAQNNIITLRSSQITDTLALRFPVGITSNSYLVLSSPNVPNGGTMVIDPGVNLKFNGSLHINVQTNGAIKAIGTELLPITFTSWRDITVGGKTHPVSDTTTARPGDWYGIGIWASSPNSHFEHARFKYAGRGLEIYSTQANHVYNNLDIRHMSSRGIYASNSKFTLDNSTIHFVSSDGIYIDSNSDLNIRNSVIENNSGHGLQAQGAAYREVSNSTIRNNLGHGIFVNNGNIPQTFLGNIIENNGSSGIANQSSAVPMNDVTYVGNQLKNNGQEGILTSRARFIDNTFDGNRHAIGYWKRLGYSFVDNEGNDGNIIINNQYNKAISLRADELSDTLSTHIPIGIPEPVYHVISYTGNSVRTGSQLTITPGVNLKFFPNIYMAVNGTIYAVGTETDPIVITSYRDHSAGGKTNLPSDTVSAKGGDWGYIYYNNVNSRNSRIANAQIGYGIRALEFYHPQDSLYSDIRFHNTSWHAVVTYERLRFDHVTIEHSGQSGIVTLGNNADVSIYNSVIRNNAAHGLFSDNGNGGFREVLNTQIYNNDHGVLVSFATLPQSLINNRVHDNRSHGIFINAKNDAIDSLLIIGNSVIYENAGVGILTSRAYITSDSIYGNQMAIGHTGQLSLAGTINDQGNLYLDNVIFDNSLDDVTRLQGQVSGILGGTNPYGLDRPVYQAAGNVLINGSDSLIVKDGTIVKFLDGSAYLQSNGRISVRGTVDRKVVFTSWRDDTYGGDSNQDSTATQPAPNNWYWFYLNGTNNNFSEIKNAIVRYATFGLYIANNTATIDSSSFSNNQYGLFLESSAAPTIRNNDIHSNAQDGIYAGAVSASTTINLNNFYNNSRALRNVNSITLNATNNYWGDATGPLVTTGPDLNPSGLGDIILVSSGTVNYRPFLTSRTGILLGDVSENGSISAFDASMVLQYLVSLLSLSPTQEAAADVTGDGSISEMDASFILQYVVGRITGFPGAGKLRPQDLANGFELAMNRTGDDVDVLIRLNGNAQVFGGGIHLTYPEDAVESITDMRTAATDNWIRANSNQDAVYRHSLAGVSPVDDASDLMHIRLKLKEGTHLPLQQLLAFDLFRLNETDLTEMINAQVTSIDPFIGLIPIAFDLNQNYPNPFNPNTTIQFSLPTEGQVSLQIYNVIGQLVATLAEDMFSAGYHTVQWDARTMASGVYMYKINIRASDGTHYTETRKMTLMK